ncbi:dTDP-4-dehydrorhamnose reductase [Rhizobium hidalgonense]|uniref:dTDP-4-dehydrorhamnose reductase n=1 Tax=Rhizobium hidalgonense TaxID=1538159 RepID=A0A2A6KB60_9HYPH|nr:dTDP-4-dehydrorhamnose reductase [Rhizobium hidalgonense]MDR9774979.1 dTDP-4-dehydrorhamnose reductase [Rhizobium hidalgonense]MDR9806352.1 dTDP-4-dehydrorhamnose reductase [Rhizobium hidalgonense]MDR9813322.1 dTDP-4-dehydrorhamnose reductase [Rhizobium hidalgonense]MDR9823459.1 dTDP-4-dehydrorhamnose reductase [Rhizobium hidalgonense]PDT21649.1 dTDP-4-dehydrorhamnose reductase [Rhizobium hidalgonense]
MHIVVTGKQGQVVQSLLRRGAETGVEISAVGRPEMDLADPASIAAAFSALRPDVIVSAAAYTAVDKAESEAELAFSVNATGAGAVAGAAARIGVPVIHISTDYVFGGDKASAYSEEDVTAPISVYGRSKLAGETAVAAANPNHVILRTAWVYSSFGTNFLKTMLRLSETRDHLRVVADQTGCPTSALDIADAILAIAARVVADPAPSLRGTFHLTGSGEASWADFAEEIFAELSKSGGRKVAVERIPTADYPTPAKRPANSRLNGDKLARTYGIRLPEWRQSMMIIMQDLLNKGL